MTISASAVPMISTLSRRAGRRLLYSRSTVVCQAARLARLCSRRMISWLSGTAAADKALNWLEMDWMLGCAGVGEAAEADVADGAFTLDVGTVESAAS